MSYLLLVLAPLLHFASPAPPDPPSARWVNGSGDDLVAVAGYTVIEYRDAGRGGVDWALTGEGLDGGNGLSQLWLFTAPKRAYVAFTAPSEAVAFMLDGDYNDGVATFLVDGIEIGTYDMYRRGNRTLLVEGLERVPHRIEVRAEGRKVSRSKDTHIALYGGAALSNERVTRAEYARPPIADGARPQ